MSDAASRRTQVSFVTHKSRRSRQEAGKQKLSLRRKQTWSAAIAVITLAGVLVSVPALAEVKFASPDAAFEKGMAAYRARHFDDAIPAFKAAAEQGNLFATFYLARIYSDHARPITDHAKAYKLYSEIVDRYYSIDPKDFRRSPTVAKSITAMARYVQNGLPEIGLEADRAHAVHLFRYAAQYYNEPDAQFELAKLQLVGEGVRQDVRSALYWFSRLVKRGHPSAQAYLADLLWRGDYLKRDPMQALALVTIARRNAPQHELIWIDDVYQDVYCGTSPKLRTQVHKQLAALKSKSGAQGWRAAADSGSLGWLSGPMRVCSDGTQVALPDLSHPPLSKDAEMESERAAGVVRGSVSDVKSILILGLTAESVSKSK